jgi:hypothetical protein
VPYFFVREPHGVLNSLQAFELTCSDSEKLLNGAHGPFILRYIHALMVTQVVAEQRGTVELQDEAMPKLPCDVY